MQESFRSFQELRKGKLNPIELLAEAKRDILHACEHKPHGLKKVHEAQEMDAAFERAIAVLEKKYSNGTKFQAAVHSGTFSGVEDICIQTLHYFASKWVSRDEQLKHIQGAKNDAKGGVRDALVMPLVTSSNVPQSPDDLQKRRERKRQRKESIERKKREG